MPYFKEKWVIEVDNVIFITILSSYIISRRTIMKKLLLAVILSSTMGVAMAQAGYTSSTVGNGLINSGSNEYDSNPPGNTLNSDTVSTDTMGNSGSYGSSSSGSSAYEGSKSMHGTRGSAVGSSMHGTGQYYGPDSRGNGADSAYTYSRGGLTNANSPGNLNDPIVQRRTGMHGGMHSGSAGSSLDAGTSVPSIGTQPQSPGYQNR